MALPSILLEGDEPSITLASSPVPFHVGEPWAKSDLPESDSLPEAYGTGKLFLLARDPDCIYAHWDLSLEQQHEYNTLSIDRHLVLRVFVEEKRGAPFREIHLHPESQSWFVYVDRGGSAYIAELGYYERGGEWVGIADSEPISTPPVVESLENRVQFATVQPSQLPGIQTQPEVIQPSPRPSAAIVRQLVETVATLPCSATADEHVPAVSQPSVNSFLQAHRAEGETPKERFAPPPHLTLIPSEEIEYVYGPVSEVEWTETQERALEQIVATTLVSHPTSSLENVQNVEENLGKELTPVTESQGVQLRPSPLSVSVSDAGKEQPQSISSEFHPAPPLGREFWFAVNAELVIYGATDPTATVTIGDRRIHLRPDGSFSYRFALPDGTYQLPISATSVENDRRHVTLTFNRATDSSGEVGRHPQDPALQPPAVENFT